MDPPSIGGQTLVPQPVKICRSDIFYSKKLVGLSRLAVRQQLRNVELGSYAALLCSDTVVRACAPLRRCLSLPQVPQLVQSLLGSRVAPLDDEKVQGIF